jgi:hypothetical protein
MDQQPTERNMLATVISGHIEDRGLTLRQVSDATSIPLTTLHRRLRADTDHFRVNELAALAALFGIAPSALLTESEVAA